MKVDAKVTVTGKTMKLEEPGSKLALKLIPKKTKDPRDQKKFVQIYADLLKAARENEEGTFTLSGEATDDALALESFTSGSSASK